MTAIDFRMKPFFSGETRLIGACPWGCSPIKQCDLIFRWIKIFSKQALISSLLSAYHSCPGTFSRQREPAIVGRMRLLTRLCGESVECLGTSWARTKNKLLVDKLLWWSLWVFNTSCLGKRQRSNRTRSLVIKSNVWWNREVKKFELPADAVSGVEMCAFAKTELSPDLACWQIMLHKS